MILVNDKKKLDLSSLEELVDYLSKGKTFTQKLIEENEQLRITISKLENTNNKDS